jgi:hypothetical protein
MGNACGCNISREWILQVASRYANEKEFADHGAYSSFHNTGDVVICRRSARRPVQLLGPELCARNMHRPTSAAPGGGNDLERQRQPFDQNGSNIIESSLAQIALHHGTNIHGFTVTHAISSLSTSG